jgi:hypothetical protein
VSKPKVRFIVIDEVSELGRRAYGPYESFREAAGDAMTMTNAYVLPIEKPAAAARIISSGPPDRA